MAAWTTDSPNECTARIGNRLAWITVGSPTHFCYSDGNYLGSAEDMKTARRICEKGKIMVDEVVASTETEYKELKNKPKWKWEPSGVKDEIRAVVEGEKVPARIRTLDKQTHAVYRGGRYLGSEDSLDKAKMRAALNKVGEKNRVMRLWEKTHPDELPPALAMTDEERKEYWRHNPPPKPKPLVPGAVKHSAAREALAAEGSAGKPARAKAARATGDSPVAVPTGIIRVIKADNPKKAGTGAHERWAKLFSFDGKTVEAYAAAKGNLTTLENAVKKGCVKVEEDK
jgi:hypothetical protein